MDTEIKSCDKSPDGICHSQLFWDSTGKIGTLLSTNVFTRSILPNSRELSKEGKCVFCSKKINK